MSKQSFNKLVGLNPANSPRIKALPRMPAAMLSKRPEARMAQELWMAQLEEWRKSIEVGPTTLNAVTTIKKSTQTTVVSGGSSSATEESTITPAAPPSDPSYSPIIRDYAPNGLPVHIGDVWINWLTKKVWMAAGILSINDWVELTNTPVATAVQPVYYVNETTGQLFQQLCRNNVDGYAETYLRPVNVFELGGVYYELRSRLNIDGVKEPYLVEDVDPVLIEHTCYLKHPTSGLGYPIVLLETEGSVTFALGDTGVSTTPLAERIEVLKDDGSDVDYYACRDNPDGEPELYAMD